jgi:hypothetical protein
VNVTIQGEAGGNWVLTNQDGRWRLCEGAAQSPSAGIVLSDDTAWRIFTKGPGREEAAGRVRIEGDRDLGAPFLSALAIMA